MGTMARLSGFSPVVLRAWEKRHGLLEPERGPGGHRLYTEYDLRVLRRVSVLLAEGHRIGEIALAGREALATEATESLHGEPVLGGTDPRGTPPHRVATELEARCRDIVDAAVAIDGPRLQQALDTAFALVAPETVVCQVLEPAARAIGDLWASGQCSVAGEHLASQAFIARLHRLIEARNTTHPAESPVVLCACLPGERHEIGALVLAFFLARTGLRVSYLGADLPLEDLEAAITRLAARAVYLSVKRPPVLEAHRARLLDLVERRGGEVVFLIGGSGVTGHEADLLEAGARLWPEARSVWELEAEERGTGDVPGWIPPAVR